MRQLDHRNELGAEADRQTASLAGLAVALLLVVLGLLLIRALHTEAKMEDCLLAGRSNCGQAVVRGSF
jgi:hypothetical protein